ncbi:MAG: hypothetical protein KTR16_15020 [Acidiferrobacterales bacterium]|nr:hypothetical protein [Acidiferrobacterales bacterium]
MKFGKLKSLRLLSFDGADTASFLQGQLTNDVNILDAQWQYAGYCNPKGRLIALLYLWKANDEKFFALVDAELAESVLTRLRMYVMRSKVTIDIENRTLLGFDSLNSLTQHKPDFKQLDDYSTPKSVCSLENNQWLLNLDSQYLLVGEEFDDVDSFDGYWHRHLITHGIPRVNAKTSELFIPQMVNLDLLAGINFKKGCYTGQEIVARMHYLGNLKQRMFVCTASSNLEEEFARDKIFSNLQGDKSVGNIVSSVAHSSTFLAVLKLSTLNGDLHLNSGLKIQLAESQPYPIPVS